MNKEKQYGKDLGILFGSLSSGINPSGVNVEDGYSSAYEEDFRNKRHSHIMKAARIIIADHLGEDSLSLRHLDALASVNRHHSSHVKEASDLVFDTIKNYKPMSKKSNWWLGLLGTAGSGALWAGAGAAAGVGALGGSLYHLTQKEVEEENAENEVKKRKIEYYKNLARELNRNMSKKYDYAG